MKIRALTLAVAFLIGIAAFAGNENDSEESSAKKASKKTTTLVQGQVMDLTSGESIAGAEVKIKGSTKRTYTDFDGNFSFQNMEPGNYDIIVSYISYNKSLLEDIEVTSGQSENLRVKLVNTK